MDAKPLYDSTELLIERLIEVGQKEWAETLKGDMLSGSAGGEIVMSLQYHLKQLLQESSKLDPETQELLHRAVSHSKGLWTRRWKSDWRG